jgi:hypothetical protein
MKWQLIIIMALLAINLAMACKDVYYADENVTIIDHVLAMYDGADCNISIHDTGYIQNGTMQSNGTVYTYYAGYLPAGIYGSDISCNVSGTNLTGECKFEVRERDEMIIAFLVGIFILTAALLYVAFAVEKVHGILKLLFITVAMMMQVFTGRLIMLAAEGTKYEALSGTLYTSILWLIRFYVVYLILYFIYTWLDMAGKMPGKLSLRSKNG